MPLLKILYCLFCQLIFICSDFNRSVLHLDLACVQTELGERSECRKQLMRAHTRTHNENSVCSHSCEVHSDGVSTVTQYSYLIT